MMMRAMVCIRFQPDSVAFLDIQTSFAVVRAAVEEALELPTEAAGAIFVKGFDHEQYAPDLEHCGANEGGHT